MPRRTGRALHPGRVTYLCQCGTAISESQVSCKPCWESLPASLRTAYLTAKRGGGPPLDRSGAAIRAHLGQAVRT